MHKLISISTLVLLVLSFGEAPFEHVHASDPDHDHARGLSHMHGMLLRADEPSLTEVDPGSDARMVEWLAGDGRFPIEQKALPAPSIAVPVFNTLLVSPLEILSRGHDPPSRSNPNPRGPPPA